MSLPTLLAEGILEALDRLDVEGDDYRHLFRARRLAVGDALRVVDGRGEAREARVESVTRSAATIALGAAAASLEATFDLELLVAAPRLERAATLVEKATELGVSAIRFFACERSPRDYGPGNLERLRRISRSAVMQCGRSRQPEIDGVHAWSQVESLIAAKRMRWVLAPGGEPCGGVPTSSPGVVIVGPEGGLNDLELEELRELQCRSIDLGPRILRVETAALAAATLCLLPR